MDIYRLMESVTFALKFTAISLAVGSLIWWLVH